MKIILFISLLLASIVVITAVDQYLFCPAYSFVPQTPFQGDSIYNPYAKMSKTGWVKCNFHAHAHCWDGLTYGYGTAEDIHRVYNKLTYGVNAVSNYQNIDTTDHNLPNYIGCYEHGYNMLKSHQLVIGTHQVCWKDYTLPQTLSNKQAIVYDIKAADCNAVIVINHPMVRNGYTAPDFGKLTQYNCMEVLNPACNSSALWDAALSAGKPIFIVGDDDAHRVLEMGNAGRICTWINVPEVNSHTVTQALKTGCSYGMTIGKNVMSEVQKGDNDSMPLLQSYSAKGNAMFVKFSLPAQEIKVVGTGGHLIDSVENSDSLSYTLQKKEPYARIVASFGNGTAIYLNPVFHYRKAPLLQASASINWTETIFRRGLGIGILVLWGTLLFRIYFGSRKKLKSSIQRNPLAYEYVSSNTTSKNTKVWHRRVVRYVHRFFYNLVMQRKNQVE